MTKSRATLAVRTGKPGTSRPEAERVMEDPLQALRRAIDEVDRVNTTPWVRETMFRLLDGRYQDQSRTLTLLATNTKPDDLPTDLQYLGSRMSGGIVTQIGGADVRLALGLIKQREAR